MLRRSLALHLRSLFVSVSDPCPALHIPNAGGGGWRRWGVGKKLFYPSAPPSLVTPKFQLLACPILHPPNLPDAPSASAPYPGARVPEVSPAPGSGVRSMVPRHPWALPTRAYLLGPLRCALVQLRVPPAARAPLWPPRPTPAPSPESLGPRERRRHEAPSRLQPLPNVAGSGPGTSRTIDWSPLLHRGIPASPHRVQRSWGWK